VSDCNRRKASSALTSIQPTGRQKQRRAADTLSLDGHCERDRSARRMLVFPFWRRKHVVYKQNRLLPAA